MKMPWKKNVRKVPEKIIRKIEEMQSESVVVATVIEITKEEIIQGKYKHLLISYDGELSYEDEVFPNPSVGRYSNYNANGRTITKKGLPKVPKSFTNTVPIFGDWGKGSVDVTRTILVFPKEYWLPQNYTIKINLLGEKEEAFDFKFSIDVHLLKNDEKFMDKLLYQCNLLMENTGHCDVFTKEASDKDYIETLQVEWEIFPPGQKNFEKNIQRLISKHRNPLKKIIDIYSDRMEFFEELKPIRYISGTNSFSSYFGAQITENLVVLESASYGNAIYILFEEWEELSKMSRTELLNSENRNFERVTHTGNWKNKVRNAMKNYE